MQAALDLHRADGHSVRPEDEARLSPLGLVDVVHHAYDAGPLLALPLRRAADKETDRTQARRARDRPPGHVYFSALGVTCQLDVLPSPSPSTSSPRVVPAVRPFDPDVPDAAEPWGGHLRSSGTAGTASSRNRLASCGFPVDFEALSAHPSPGRERWSVNWAVCPPPHRVPGSHVPGESADGLPRSRPVARCSTLTLMCCGLERVPGRLQGPARPGSRSLDVLLCRRWLLNPPRARSCCA